MAGSQQDRRYIAQREGPSASSVQAVTVFVHTRAIKSADHYPLSFRLRRVGPRSRLQVGEVLEHYGPVVATPRYIAARVVDHALDP